MQPHLHQASEPVPLLFSPSREEHLFQPNDLNLPVEPSRPHRLHQILGMVLNLLLLEAMAMCVDLIDMNNHHLKRELCVWKRLKSGIRKLARESTGSKIKDSRDERL